MLNKKILISLIVSTLVTVSVSAKDYSYNKNNRNVSYWGNEYKEQKLDGLNQNTKEFIIKSSNELLNKKFERTFPKTVQKEFNKYNKSIVHSTNILISAKMNKKINEIDKKQDIRMTNVKNQVISLKKKINQLEYNIEKQKELIKKFKNFNQLADKLTDKINNYLIRMKKEESDNPYSSEVNKLVNEDFSKYKNTLNEIKNNMTTSNIKPVQIQKKEKKKTFINTKKNNKLNNKSNNNEIIVQDIDY